MKGSFNISSAWMLRLVAGFLMQQILTVSATYTMQETCAHVATTYIADPNDCTSFGYCENGKLVGIKKCPEGHIYNARKAMCDYPSTNGCTVGNSSAVCNYAADKSFVPDPNNCNRYFYCNNRNAELRECPKDQIYDSQQTACVWSTRTSNTCMANSICRLLPDATFAGDPDNCGNYIGCNNHVGTPGKCPDNTYYNKQRGGCQQGNPCQTPAPVGFGPGVAAPLPNDPAACKAAKGETFPQFVPDKQSCIGYYICNSTAGPGVWSKCPPGLHFNNGDCVTPFSFACLFDRCGNLKQQFVGAVGSNCKNYLICKDETSQGAASGYPNYLGLACTNGQYFNEFTQRCEDTSPSSRTYQLCV